MATNPARKKINPTQSAESPINVIKEATCPTSTGKSTLGYQVGIDKKGEAHFKLASNSGGGHFSSSWISFKDVQAALKAWPQDQPVTSMALRPLSKGRSANDAGLQPPYSWLKGYWSRSLESPGYTMSLIQLNSRQSLTS